MKRMRIVVAMSGGVDSSVAAALLAEQGHDVIGVSMQLYDQSEGQTSFGTCCTIDDLYDARRVAAAIGIPHYIVNFENRFDEQVVSNFIREYARRPHADSVRALQRRPEVRRRCSSVRSALAPTRSRRDTTRASSAAADGTLSCCGAARTPAKDQTYFLFSLTQEQLARAAFPVGHLDKDDGARARAAAASCAWRRSRTARRSASCPDGDYAAFIEKAAPELKRPGALVDQRRRGGRRARRACIASPSASARGSGSRRPSRCMCSRFVPRPPRSSSVRASALGRSTLTASQVNWVSGEPPPSWTPVTRADPPPARRRAGTRARARRRSRRSSSSTSRRPPSRQDRRSCSTTEMSAWAAAGSTERTSTGRERRYSAHGRHWRRCVHGRESSRPASSCDRPDEEALGIDRGHAARAGGGDRLPIDVILHVAGGEHTRHVRARAAVRHDVAVRRRASAVPRRASCWECGRSR